MGWTVSREQHHSFIMQRGRSRSNSPLPLPLNWNWRRFSRSRTPSSPRSPPTPWSESNRSDSPGTLLRFRHVRPNRANLNGYVLSGWEEERMTRLRATQQPILPQERPILIDHVLHCSITNRPIWRQQLPWQPVRWRITRFDRHDMNPQEGARFVHDLVNLHHGHFWLHMTHELLTVDCLCNFRTTCRRARRCWVMSQPELVRRWMRCCLRTLVHAQRNIDYVQSQDRFDSYVVLQSNLWDEAQEYGVQFNQYVIHASRRSYFHRNEHWSLTRPTHQILYRPGTRGRRVFPAARPQEEPDTDPDSVDERDGWLLFMEEREERRRLQVNNDN